MPHYNSVLVPYEPHSCLLTSSCSSAPWQATAMKTPLFAPGWLCYFSFYTSKTYSIFELLFCGAVLICVTDSEWSVFWVSSAGDGLKGGELWKCCNSPKAEISQGPYGSLMIVQKARCHEKHNIFCVCLLITNVSVSLPLWGSWLGQNLQKHTMWIPTKWDNHDQFSWNKELFQLHALLNLIKSSLFIHIIQATTRTDKTLEPFRL